MLSRPSQYIQKINLYDPALNKLFSLKSAIVNQLTSYLGVNGKAKKLKLYFFIES